MVGVNDNLRSSHFALFLPIHHCPLILGLLPVLLVWLCLNKLLLPVPCAHWCPSRNLSWNRRHWSRLNRPRYFIAGLTHHLLLRAECRYIGTLLAPLALLLLVGVSHRLLVLCLVALLQRHAVVVLDGSCRLGAAAVIHLALGLRGLCLCLVWRS